MISFEFLEFFALLALFGAHFRPCLATERLSMNPWRNRSRNGLLDIDGNPSRNPFGNPFIRASRVSGFGHRPSYRQSRIHGHDDHVRFAVRRHRRFRLRVGKSRHEMPVAGGDQ